MRSPTPTRSSGPLFRPEALDRGLEDWLAGNAVMKRTFRTAAIVTGLTDEAGVMAETGLGADKTQAAQRWP